MGVPVPGFWTYVKQGADWAGRFISKPGEAAAEYFDPSKMKERTKEQAEALLKGGTPSPVPKPAEIPDFVPDFVKEPFAKLGKYAKYAAIGGAALIGLALLRRR